MLKFWQCFNLRLLKSPQREFHVSFPANFEIVAPFMSLVTKQTKFEQFNLRQINGCTEGRMQKND